MIMVPDAKTNKLEFGELKRFEFRLGYLMHWGIVLCNVSANEID